MKSRALRSGPIAALVAVAAIVVSALGCEAIVGDSVGGTVHCTEAPGACPTGQTCVGGICKPACSGASCGSDAGFDAPHDTGFDTTMHDVATDKPIGHDTAGDTSTLRPLGAACSSNAGCQSGICATSAVLTSNVVTPSGESVCTRVCCTSADCNDTQTDGFVCYPSLGGNYCVDPKWIGLPVVAGDAGPGATCAGAGDCRSSVCDTTSGACADTCCLDTDCQGGTVCQYAVLDGTPSFNCGPSGGKATQGDDCSFSKCASNGCVKKALGSFPYEEYFCLGACCKDSDCQDPAGFGTTSCNWNMLQAKTGVVELRGCSPALNDAGAPVGSTCGADTDCQTNLCYQKSTCTSACCTSDDCPMNWTCSYGSFTFMLNTLDLQVCVPPS